MRSRFISDRVLVEIELDALGAAWSPFSLEGTARRERAGPRNEDAPTVQLAAQEDTGGADEDVVSVAVLVFEVVLAVLFRPKRLNLLCRVALPLGADPPVECHM